MDACMQRVATYTRASISFANSSLYNVMGVRPLITYNNLTTPRLMLKCHAIIVVVAKKKCVYKCVLRRTDDYEAHNVLSK